MKLVEGYLKLVEGFMNLSEGFIKTTSHIFKSIFQSLSPPTPLPPIKYFQYETMKSQKEILNNKIENWKAWPATDGSARNFEQIDDICVIGVRV